MQDIGVRLAVLFLPVKRIQGCLHARYIGELNVQILHGVSFEQSCAVDLSQTSWPLEGGALRSHRQHENCCGETTRKEAALASGESF